MAKYVMALDAEFQPAIAEEERKTRLKGVSVGQK